MVVVVDFFALHAALMSVKSGGGDFKSESERRVDEDKNVRMYPTPCTPFILYVHIHTHNI